MEYVGEEERERQVNWRRVRGGAVYGSGLGAVLGVAAAAYRGLDHANHASYAVVRNSRVSHVRTGPVAYAAYFALSTGLLCGSFALTREMIHLAPFRRPQRAPRVLVQAVAADAGGQETASALYWRVLDDAIRRQFQGTAGEGKRQAGGEVEAEEETEAAEERERKAAGGSVAQLLANPLASEYDILSVDAVAGVLVGGAAGVLLGLPVAAAAAGGGLAAGAACVLHQSYRESKDEAILLGLVHQRLEELHAEGSVGEEEMFEVEQELLERVGVVRAWWRALSREAAAMYRTARRAFPVMREVDEEEIEKHRLDSRRRADFEIWKKQRNYEMQVRERRQAKGEAAAREES